MISTKVKTLSFPNISRPTQSRRSTSWSMLLLFTLTVKRMKSNKYSATAKDDVNVDGLRDVPVPAGLSVEIIEFD